MKQHVYAEEHYCPSCKRVTRFLVEVFKNGWKQLTCKSCGEVYDDDPAFVRSPLHQHNGAR